ncbi:CBN-PEB-1 protein [Aphelenchoides avenae]|nr:CBN-PEB-1 protein [Aphelenchus avenae]
MYEFQGYDPAKPRMVTSFKGNQKLIFEGYRYNIHHIVPAKGVKTWRCVCAKKLTSARSWCKGRAETWDDDTQGISKGEHNHAAEHEIAELEYFKSQLILAAIASPNAALNVLIDEATKYMSPGLKFGSTESLKKSLTVARKSAENGGFKLKCYKNSSCSDSPKLPKTNGNELFSNELKLFEVNGTMASLLSLARQCQEQENNEDGHLDASNDQSTSSTSSIIQSVFNGTCNTSASDFIDTDADISPLAKAIRLDASASSAYESATSPFNESLANGHDHSGVNSPSARSTPLSAIGHSALPTQVLQQKKNAIDKAIRTARVNDIFNKLSQKAAAATKTAGSSSSPMSTPSRPVTSSMNGTSSASSSTAARKMCTVETQTSASDLAASGGETPQQHGFDSGTVITLNACLQPTATNCNCRVIRVCCCSEDTCKQTGKKRPYSEISNADGGSS